MAQNLRLGLCDLRRPQAPLAIRGCQSNDLTWEATSRKRLGGLFLMDKKYFKGEPGASNYKAGSAFLPPYFLLSEGNFGIISTGFREFIRHFSI